MDQDLNNIDVATIPNDAVGQLGDCIVKDPGLGSKVTELIAIVANQQTMIEGLIDQASDERRVTTKCRDKFKTMSTRIKESEDEYGVFRKNLQSEIVERERRHNTQQDALDALRQEMGRKLAAKDAEITALKSKTIKTLAAQIKESDKEYKVFRGNLFAELVERDQHHQDLLKEFVSLKQTTTQQLTEYQSEVTDLKSALWSEMAARMALDAKIFEMKFAQSLKDEEPTPTVEGKVKSPSPRGNEKENVPSRGSPTLTGNSSASNTPANKKMTIKPTKTLSPSNGQARKYVSVVNSNRFTKNTENPQRPTRISRIGTTKNSQNPQGPVPVSNRFKKITENPQGPASTIVSNRFTKNTENTQGPPRVSRIGTTVSIKNGQTASSIPGARKSLLPSISKAPANTVSANATMKALPDYAAAVKTSAPTSGARKSLLPPGLKALTKTFIVKKIIPADKNGQIASSIPGARKSLLPPVPKASAKIIGAKNGQTPAPATSARQSVLPTVPKKLSKAVKDVKNPASTSVTEVIASAATTSVTVQPTGSSKRPADATDGLTASSSLEALDAAMAQFEDASLSSERAIVGVLVSAPSTAPSGLASSSSLEALDMAMAKFEGGSLFAEQASFSLAPSPQVGIANGNVAHEFAPLSSAELASGTGVHTVTGAVSSKRLSKGKAKALPNPNLTSSSSLEAFDAAIAQLRDLNLKSQRALDNSTSRTIAVTSDVAPVPAVRVASGSRQRQDSAFLTVPSRQSFKGKAKALPTPSMTSSSSLEALDMAMAKFKGDSLLAEQAPFSLEPYLAADIADDNVDSDFAPLTAEELASGTGPRLVTGAASSKRSSKGKAKALPTFTSDNIPIPAAQVASGSGHRSNSEYLTVPSRRSFKSKAKAIPTPGLTASSSLEALDITMAEFKGDSLLAEQAPFNLAPYPEADIADGDVDPDFAPLTAAELVSGSRLRPVTGTVLSRRAAKGKAKALTCFISSSSPQVLDTVMAQINGDIIKTVRTPVHMVPHIVVDTSYLALAIGC
ncbi:hypothetical protein BJ138DRAFT_500150 [Hygrophoropsis aurantiaca]|uniref:Uncharacterized protein n=1 Tax=Hygrophoropsis aurantiaca TaxID=72124 RepID=A0ACB8A261_9AGAM|nr:hypothetical protein BJ138DRAFT_500150 [Hygrophoropsis aurantiaca]